jgi:hypothetical protein
MMKSNHKPHRNMMVPHALFRKAGKHGKNNKQERVAERSKADFEDWSKRTAELLEIFNDESRSAVSGSF